MTIFILAMCNSVKCLIFYHSFIRQRPIKVESSGYHCLYLLLPYGSYPAFHKTQLHKFIYYIFHNFDYLITLVWIITLIITSIITSIIGLLDCWIIGQFLHLVYWTLFLHLQFTCVNSIHLHLHLCLKIHEGRNMINKGTSLSAIYVILLFISDSVVITHSVVPTHSGVSNFKSKQQNPVLIGSLQKRNKNMSLH